MHVQRFPRTGNADLFPEEMGQGVGGVGAGNAPSLNIERCVMEAITRGLDPTRGAVITSAS